MQTSTESRLLPLLQTSHLTSYVVVISYILCTRQTTTLPAASGRIARRYLHYRRSYSTDATVPEQTKLTVGKLTRLALLTEFSALLAGCSKYGMHVSATQW